jgi:uncharacterized protein (TIGR03083 family)
VLLTPRYDGEPLLRFDLAQADPARPVARQRLRLGETLAGLDDEQWAAPSRCEGWSVRDVVSHLVSTNHFWAISASSGLAGTPTTILATFDPVTSPARLVDDQRSVPAAAILEQYQESTASLVDLLEGLDEGAWEALAEAPPGHVALRAVMAHALWDAWVHERDIVLPLGLEPAEEPDEVAVSLAYAAALGPGFAVATGSTRCGRLAVHATDPDVRVVVEVDECVHVREGGADADTPCLTGAAVELVEGLSLRVPLVHRLAEDDRWLVAGLDVVFDQAG